ncbi:nucleotidyltransferase domain-containing protein [Cytobacillus oceanisediminis]|uniref:nucleotidyltransferase domain-containing protein n=1 Tax=Cytobacillus oceanisediminis TaxID=665099 RepID=UPI001D1580D5|nr:nucleotidyltransferase domain-containing protein [Cytobacillus oceanisediminis]MCC3648144.1 nucleotidyltransferase domain-containing protein [Cytobacillus oceanisediminis]
MDREKIQLSLRTVPEDIDIYIFGSYLFSEYPKDVDLIVIYNSNIYNGKNIFDKCLNLIIQLETKSGLPVDVTYLSIIEENEIGFLKIVNAMPIKDVFYINN